MSRFLIILMIGTGLALIALALAAPAAHAQAIDEGAGETTGPRLVEWQVDAVEIDGAWWSVLTVRNLNAYNVELVSLSYKPCLQDTGVAENLKDMLRARLLEGDLLMPRGGEMQLRLAEIGECLEFELTFTGPSCPESQVIKLALE